jgi:hypothetical protein
MYKENVFKISLITETVKTNTLPLAPDEIVLVLEVKVIEFVKGHNSFK